MADLTFEHTYETPGTYTPTWTDAQGTLTGPTITVLDPTAKLATPTGVAGEPGETVAQISWTAVPGAGRYVVRYRVAGSGGEYISTTPVTTTTTEITGLTAGTSYEVGVQAQDPAGIKPDSDWSPDITVTTTTPTPVLATPTGLATGTVTDTSVVLTWNAVTNADRYIVQYREDGAAAWIPRAFVTTTTDTVPGLTPGTAYEFQVKAQDSTGVNQDSPFSTSVTATTSGGPSEVTPDKTVVVSTGDATARTITVGGTGFPASTAITMTLRTGAPGSGGTEIVARTGTATTDASGNFTGALLVVPANTVGGPAHIVTTVASVTNDEVAIDITGPMITPDKTTVDVTGDETARTITVGGANFPASTALTLVLNTGAPGSGGTQIVAGTGTATTNASGAFTGALLVVPDTASAGPAHIIATVGSVVVDNTAVTLTDGPGLFSTESAPAKTTTTRKRK